MHISTIPQALNWKPQTQHQPLPENLETNFVQALVPKPNGFRLVVFLLLPRRPDVKHWLFSENDMRIAMRRNAEAFNAARPSIHWKQLIKVIKDPKCWLYSAFISPAMILSNPL